MWRLSSAYWLPFFDCGHYRLLKPESAGRDQNVMHFVSCSRAWQWWKLVCTQEQTKQHKCSIATTTPHPLPTPPPPPPKKKERKKKRNGVLVDAPFWCRQETARKSWKQLSHQESQFWRKRITKQDWRSCWCSATYWRYCRNLLSVVKKRMGRKAYFSSSSFSSPSRAHVQTSHVLRLAESVGFVAVVWCVLKLLFSMSCNYSL